MHPAHLDDLLNRSIFNLSSGEKQKIAIAAACAIHPSVVVLDEPSANLDVESTQQLAFFLEAMRAQGLTIIVSEHRLYYLAHLMDRMVVMEKGRIKQIYSAQEARKIPSGEMVRMGLRLFELSLKELHHPAKKELPLVDISDISFSGGQKQRVLLAAALLRKRPLLILDEPTSGLDGKHMRIMAGLLRQIADNGIGILLITHYMEFSQLVADKVVCMKDGTMVTAR